MKLRNSLNFSSYIIEYFYQVKRKNQTFPVAQLVGRMDFTLFLSPFESLLFIDFLILNRFFIL